MLSNKYISTIEALEEEIQDIRELREEAESLGTSSFSARLQIASLLQHEKRLTDELKAAHLIQDGIAVQIVVDGRPVRNHAISADFMGHLLVEFQAFINALGAELQGLSSKRRGKHKTRVRSHNELRVSTLMPTSFGLNFKVEQSAKQSSLFDEEDNEGAAWQFAPDAVNILHTFFDGDTSAAELTEVVAIPRIRARYRALMNLFATQGASIEVRTLRHPLPVKLEPNQAISRREWINKIQNDVQVIEIQGVLTGFNIRMQTFEIISGNDKYSGSATDYATSLMRRMTGGSYVSANILKVTEAHQSLNVSYKVSYILRVIELTTIEQ